MDSHTFVIFAGSFSTVSMVGLGVYAYNRRFSSPAVLPFALLMFSAAFAAAAYSVELNTDSLEQTILLLKIEYVGDTLLPPFWFLFASAFVASSATDCPRLLSPWGIAALAVVPVVTIILIWTNESHHLIYTSLKLREDSSLSILVAGRGPWYWVSTAYFYVLMAGGALLVILRAARAEGRFRGQNIVLVVAVVLPWIGHALLLAHLGPFGIDLTPFLFAISGILLAMGIFKFGMFDLVPVARAMVLDAIRDGVIVVDRAGRIVDANRAARAAVPGLDDEISSPHSGNLLAQLGIPTRGEAELSIDSGAGGRWYRAIAIEIEGEGRRHGTAVILADIDESKRLLVRLERLATTDELTKVDNRRRFFEHTERELAIARRTARPVSFAMLDLDLFKRVNDERGHAAGDAALVAVCGACREALRSSDILCRYGGEEFMIILPEVAPRDALEIVERVRIRVETERVHSDFGIFGVTASFGVSGYAAGGTELESIELYLRRCDEALYRAKAAGRNCVRLYGADS